MAELIGRGLVAQAEGHPQPDAVALGEVLQPEIGELRVGHGDHGAVQGAHAGGAHPDALHRPHLVAEAAEVADLHGLIRDEGQPSEEMLHRLLGREGHRDAAHAEAGDEGGDVHAQHVQHGEESQDQHQCLRHPLGEIDDGERGHLSAPDHGEACHVAHHVHQAQAEPGQGDHRDEPLHRAERGVDGHGKGERNAPGVEDADGDEEAKGRHSFGGQPDRAAGRLPARNQAQHEQAQCNQQSGQEHGGPGQEDQGDPLPEGDAERPALHQHGRKNLADGPVAELPVEVGNARHRRLGELPDEHAVIARQALEQNVRRPLAGGDAAHQLAVRGQAVVARALRAVGEHIGIDEERVVEDDAQVARQGGPLDGHLRLGHAAQIEILGRRPVVVPPSGLEEARHGAPGRAAAELVHHGLGLRLGGGGWRRRALRRQPPGAERDQQAGADEGDEGARGRSARRSAGWLHA